jgi:hypothetical protein
MTTAPVVKDLDVLEDGQLRRSPVRPGVAIDELLLEGCEEAFGNDVVLARRRTADALHKPRLPQGRPERHRRVLTTAVAVKDTPGCRLAMLLRPIPTRQFTVVTYSGAPDNPRVCTARAVHGSGLSGYRPPRVARIRVVLQERTSTRE